MSVFPDKLRELRKEKRYTQEKLCELLEISRDTLSKWENGSRYPDLKELCKICDIFECDIDYLVGKIEKRTHELQNVCDVTGLSIESVMLLKEWNTMRKEASSRELFTGKYIRSYIDYLDNFLKYYPELLYDIDTALFSDDTAYSKYTYNPDLMKANKERTVKSSCMKVAVKLWDFINTGKKSHSLFDENVSKFASDFIYERLSFLETVLHNKQL